MADVRGAWNETGEKLTELGRKLKVHYEQQHSGEGQQQQARQELVDAARRLGSAVQDAFEAIGAAARDKSVQDDVKHVGQSLVEALGATLGQATEDVRRAFAERKGAAASRQSEAAQTEEKGAEPGAEAGEPLPAEPSAAPPEGTAEASPEGEGAKKDDDDPKLEPWGTP